MFKTTVSAIALAAALGTTSAGQAQQPSQFQYPTPQLQALVTHDLGSDSIRCAAYYGIGTLLAKRDWPNLDHSAMERAYSRFNTLGLAMLGPQVALAYYKIATDEISRDVQGDTNRMPIVIAKFGPLCQDLLDHPATRRDYWLKMEEAGLASAKK